MPHPQTGVQRSDQHPTLKAAKVRSWKQLALGCTAYSLDWLDDETVITITRKINMTTKNYKPVEIYRLSANTTISTLIEFMLEDVEQHKQSGQ